MDQEKRQGWGCIGIALAFVGLAMVLLIAIGGALFANSGFFPSGALGGDKVALVRVENIILDADKINRQLRKWADDDSVKAIVLRINSPGGAVAPSQEIFMAVQRAAAKKPVVASMGAVAASGGYYVAAPCKVIYANPGTVTGSIGVIMNLSNMEKLMEKIGWAPMVIKSGKFKDTGSPFRPMSDEERKFLQSVADDIHTQFVEDVARGRRMEPVAVRALADGRIFTGRDAVDLKLVDKIGGLEDAVDAAAQLAGLKPNPEIAEDKDRESVMEWLFDGKTSLVPARAGLASGFYYLWPAW